MSDNNKTEYKPFTIFLNFRQIYMQVSVYFVKHCRK